MLKDVERCQLIASMYNKNKCDKVSLPSTGQFWAQVPHKGFLVLSQLLHLADLALSGFLRPIRTK